MRIRGNKRCEVSLDNSPLIQRVSLVLQQVYVAVFN